MTPKVLSFLSLGGNIEPRAKYLRDALESLRAISGIAVLRSSMLYETQAMYITDQASFLNAVVAIETVLEPPELLQAVKDIERLSGRAQSDSSDYVRFGPRVIDIDILSYGEVILESEALTIPHPRLSERAFVLVPLLDVVEGDYKFPGFTETVGELVARDPVSCTRVLAVGDKLLCLPSRLDYYSPVLMGIVNATPDSFAVSHGSFELAVEHAVKLSAEGAAIIDIGGVSSRPNAEWVETDEEWARIGDVLKSCVSDKLFVSVDTFRPQVAQQAIAAGAVIVNDVSGGFGHEIMMSTVKHLRTPYIIMHITPPDSNPSNLNELLHRKSKSEDIIEKIARDLLKRVETARSLGIPDWDIILDVGFGFGKSDDENWELVERFEQIRRYANKVSDGLRNNLFAYPIVGGVSRKRFIRGSEDVGSLETIRRSVNCAVSLARKGCEILRVHDVSETRQALKQEILKALGG